MFPPEARKKQSIARCTEKMTLLHFLLYFVVVLALTAGRLSSIAISL